MVISVKGVRKDCIENIKILHKIMQNRQPIKAATEKTRLFVNNVSVSVFAMMVISV